MASWTPHGPAQTARNDDGKEGRSSCQARRPLLSLPKLASACRELGEWSDHALLPDLRSEAGNRRQAERDRGSRMGWNHCLVDSVPTT